MSKTAHLTKVMVQTVWVVVDSDTGEAVEMADSGVAVPAADWPTFYERHASDFAGIQAAAAAEGQPGPNRATRRKQT